MRILALITARGGSKRLPGKNIRLLGGIPLIQWSIDIAKDVPEVCDIMVSTDDSKIAEIASSAGAMVPWLRPQELATDTASSVDVCLHALDWYESTRGEVDGLLLLQPTSPFRSLESIQRGVEIFTLHNRSPVVGVSCTQSNPPVYAANGAFYLIAPSDLRESRSFYYEKTVPLVIHNPEESIDIDTESDWKMAEAVIVARGAAQE